YLTGLGRNAVGPYEVGVVELFVEFYKGYCIGDVIRAHCSPTQCREIASGVEVFSDVTGKSTDIGSCAAFHFDVDVNGFPVGGATDVFDIESVDGYFACRNIDMFTVTDALVSAFAVNFDG